MRITHERGRRNKIKYKTDDADDDDDDDNCNIFGNC